MKFHTFFSLIVLLASFALAGEKKTPAKMPPIVGAEYDKTHELFVKNFKDNAKFIEELKKEKENVIERYKSEVAFYEEGLEALNKYDVLLVVRHTDEKGEYDKRTSVHPDDIRNLNTIFQKYLKTTLLPERTSARYARKMISKAMKELNEICSDYASPDESNNPELEIIEKQLEDATRKTELVLEFAGRIGIDVKRELATDSK